MHSQAVAYLIKYMTSPVFDLNLKRGLRAAEWLLHVSPCDTIVTYKVNRKVLMSIYIKQRAHIQDIRQYGGSTSALCYYFMSPLWCWGGEGL